MKKSFFFSLLFIGLLSLAFTVPSVAQTGSPEVPKQVLLLDIINVGGASNMYIFHTDKPTEIVDMKAGWGKATVEANGRAITKKFQELYTAGWRMTGTNGGDALQHYFFEK